MLIRTLLSEFSTDVDSNQEELEQRDCFYKGRLFWLKQRRQRFVFSADLIVKGPPTSRPVYRGCSSVLGSPVPVTSTTTHLSLSVAVAAPAARRAAALPPRPAPSSPPPQAVRDRREKNRDRRPTPPLLLPPSWSGQSTNDVTRTQHGPASIFTEAGKYLK